MNWTTVQLIRCQCVISLHALGRCDATMWNITRKPSLRSMFLIMLCALYGRNADNDKEIQHLIACCKFRERNSDIA